MTDTPFAQRNRATVEFKSLALNGIFMAGMLFVASPALADKGKNCEKNSKAPECTQGVPAPLAAAGIPGLIALGGGYIALRKRRRANQANK